jgi:hypothetical protein
MFAPLQAVDVYPSVVGEFETDIGTTTETMEQALPNEVIASILDVLFGDQAMHTLATVASSNKMMYDLAIPRLYDIIRITDTNQDKLLFGCTGTSAFDTTTLMSRSSSRTTSRQDKEGPCYG